MHANYRPGSRPLGLSISMPNTFAMAPGYVRRYIVENQLIPPEIDVFDLLEAKLARVHLPSAQATRGSAWQQDVREPIPSRLRKQPAKLVFTSPPYLSVISYGKYNWVRLWMLKQDPKEVDRKLIATGSLGKYINFMKDVFAQLHEAVREDGYLCLMIGDVRERSTGRVTNLAECVWNDAARTSGWHQVAIIADRLPNEHKVSRIWKHTRGHATKTDRILVLSRRKRSRGQLPPLNPIQWSSATAWA
jgi:site-specific DNA-methyltransferase (adenine-specific)